MKVYLSDIIFLLVLIWGEKVRKYIIWNDYVYEVWVGLFKI